MPGNRHIKVGETRAEVADLLLAFSDSRQRRRCRLTGAVGGDETDGVNAVEQRRRIECAERSVGYRRVARVERDPRRSDAVFVEAVFESPGAAFTDRADEGSRDW